MNKISEIEPKEVIDGFYARFIHTDKTTLGFWKVKKDSVLPIHSHIQEQTTMVMEGQFEMTINGETRIYEPDMVAVIPSNVEHGGKALTDCKLIDVFCPVREDYKTKFG